MEVARTARTRGYNLRYEEDYQLAIFELILGISKEKKRKPHFLQRAACAMRQRQRMKGMFCPLSENNLICLAAQIRNSPCFTNKQHDNPDIYPEYIREVVSSFRKRVEIPKVKSGIKPKQEFVPTNIYKKGDVIDGKYEVRGILGKGGFGVVYLVYCRATREVLALKTFRDELLADSAARKAFKKEALLWVNLEMHPFILDAGWVDEVSGRLFVSMDYIAPDAQGRASLADHLARTKAPLDTDQALKWAIQFCLGMEHATAHGVECHRDIKPDNILITPDGTLKISDFGLSAAAEVAWRGSSGFEDSLVTGSEEGGFGFSLMEAEGKVRCGTPGYMAPEVYRYEGADIRSDIYSFGLVLWQMAVGSRNPPFTATCRDDVESYLRGIYDQQMVGHVPRMEGPLGVVIKHCLRPEPTERYESFQKLREVLEPIWKGRTGRKFEIPQIGQQTAGLWYNKGISLHHLNQYEESIGCFDKALAIDPQDAGTWNNKGTSLRMLGRHEESIICYNKALALDPHNAGAWNNKGNSLHNLSRYEEAIRCYDKALTFEPLQIGALINKGIALKVLGRHEDAIWCFDKILVIDPRYSYAWYNKALSEDALKRWHEAVDSFQKVVELKSLEDGLIVYARQRLHELESK